MARFVRPLIALTTATLLGGCASSFILNVDQNLYGDGFDLQDQQGSFISGEPGSDSFGIMVPLVDVTDDAPNGLGLAVRVGNRAEFNTADHTPPERYQVVWQGARTAQSSATSRIIFRDDAGHQAVRIEYQGNQLQPVWASNGGPGPISLNPSIPHEVRVTLNMTGATASADVRVTQNGQVILDRPNLRFIDGDFRSLDVVEVRSQTDYFMKNLVAVTLLND